MQLLLHLLRLLDEVVVGLLDLRRQLGVGGLKVGLHFLGQLLALLRDEIMVTWLFVLNKYSLLPI